MQTVIFVISAISIVTALVAAILTHYYSKTNPLAEAPSRFTDSFAPAGNSRSFKFIRTDLPTVVYGKEVGNPDSILWEGYTLGVFGADANGQLTTFRMIISGHPRGLCHYFWWSEDQEGNRLTFQNGGHVQASEVPDNSTLPILDNSTLSTLKSAMDFMNAHQTIYEAISLFARTAERLGYTHIRMDKKENGEIEMFHPSSGMQVVRHGKGYKLVPAPIVTGLQIRNPGVYVSDKQTASNKLYSSAMLEIETPYGDTLDWADVLFTRFPQRKRDVQNHYGHPRWNQGGISVPYYEDAVTERVQAVVKQVGYQTAIVDIHPSTGIRIIKVVLAPATPGLPPAVTYSVGAK